MDAKTSERMPRRMVALLGLVGLSIAACVLAIAAGWVDMETLKRLVADRSPASMA
ncbi:MAG: hypothetical protein IT373_09575, partial [Polyangiaceae bacterium]|nr:hypothetical protein [Polyangiaceae bacterium]